MIHRGIADKTDLIYAVCVNRSPAAEPANQLIYAVYYGGVELR
jgi:hypothetical protein